MNLTGHKTNKPLWFRSGSYGNLVTTVTSLWMISIVLGASLPKRNLKRLNSEQVGGGGGGGRIRLQAGCSLYYNETVSSGKLKLCDFYYTD